ncbi:hypothetical protein ACIOMQ_19105 [Streptomyces sp. NPDC087845]|uniref:hypothetical protein n=1 Tax=Streptomyces sp. NPDC087845 TaxID=3365806 RepID=UPI0037F33FA7
MKIVGRALVAAGAAMVLVAGFPLSAQAASGTFIYHTQPGDIPRFLNSPEDGRCYTVGTSADGEVQNNTTAQAQLFVGGRCRGDAVWTLPPGESASEIEFASVMFER